MSSEAERLLTEPLESIKCPKCSKEIRRIRCGKCRGKITQDMKCSKCGSPILYINCPHCNKLTVLQSDIWESCLKPIQEITEAISLEKGEKILTIWNGNRKVQRKTATKEGKGKKEKEIELGGLCLTDRRLVWVAQRGVFGKSLRVRDVIPLEEIETITSGGIFRKHISIKTGKSEYSFHLKSWIDENKRWIDTNWFAPFVEAAIENRKKDIEKKRG